MLEINTQRDAANNGRKVAYDGGTIECRTLAKDADITNEPVGTLLAVLTFDATAFHISAAGVLTAYAITGDPDATASGTIGHVVCKDSGGNVLSSHSVSLTGGAGEMQFDSLSTVLGLPVACTGLTITQPNGG